MIRCESSLEGLKPAHLLGFGGSWDSDKGYWMLLSSSHVIAAWGDGILVGFFAAVCAPLSHECFATLELRTNWEGKRIGQELLRRAVEIYGPHARITVWTQAGVIKIEQDVCDGYFETE